MKVAIVGSRDFEDPGRVRRAVRRYVSGLEPGTVIVSGGARGVDTWAEQAADDFGFDKRIHKAFWDQDGKSAGFRRNVRVAHDCDRMVAFWNGRSRGTRHVMQKARDVQKDVEVKQYR